MADTFGATSIAGPNLSYLFLKFSFPSPSKAVSIVYILSSACLVYCPRKRINYCSMMLLRLFVCESTHRTIHLFLELITQFSCHGFYLFNHSTLSPFLARDKQNIKSDFQFQFSCTVVFFVLSTDTRTIQEISKLLSVVRGPLAGWIIITINYNRNRMIVLYLNYMNWQYWRADVGKRA